MDDIHALARDIHTELHALDRDIASIEGEMKGWAHRGRIDRLNYLIGFLWGVFAGCLAMALL